MTRQYRGKKSYRPRPSSKTRFWYIGKRNKNNEIIGLLIAGALVGGGAWSSLSSSSQALLVVLLVVLVGILFVGTFAFVAFLRYRQRQKLRALSAAQVDKMDGFQFEHYVGALLQHQGYSHVQITQASGDFGVDVVASKGNQEYQQQKSSHLG